MSAKLHTHGYAYRAKLIDRAGRAEYSETFNTKAELDEAMRRITRDRAKKYRCQELRVPMIDCPDCESLSANDVLAEYDL